VGKEIKKNEIRMIIVTQLAPFLEGPPNASLPPSLPPFLPPKTLTIRMIIPEENPNIPPLPDPAIRRVDVQPVLFIII